jgi:hypothetical protein
VQTIKMRTKQQIKNIKTPKCPWIPIRQNHAWVLPDLAWPIVGFLWIANGRLISAGRRFLVDRRRSSDLGGRRFLMDLDRGRSTLISGAAAMTSGQGAMG